MNKFSILNKAILLLVILVLPITFAFSETANARRGSDDRVLTTTCGNSEDNDGVYNSCLGDTITHKNSKVVIKVLGYNATTKTVKISINNDKEYNLKYSQEIYFKYSSTNSLEIEFDGTSSLDNRFIFEVKTKRNSELDDDNDDNEDDEEQDDDDNSSLSKNHKNNWRNKSFRNNNYSAQKINKLKSSCGDSEGNNGVYNSCVKDKIKHKLAKATIRIERYNAKKDQLTVRVNSSRNIVLKPNVTHTQKLRNKRSLNITYKGISSIDGRYIIEVKN